MKVCHSDLVLSVCVCVGGGGCSCKVPALMEFQMSRANEKQNMDLT